MNKLEKLLIIIASISLLVIIALFILGLVLHSGQAHGLVDGRLKPCPDKPNCVSSEFVSDAKHYIEPLVYSAEEAAQVMPRLKTIIYEMGGSIQAEETDYLAATFTPSVFRFVDDLEFKNRYWPENNPYDVPHFCRVRGALTIGLKKYRL